MWIQARGTRCYVLIQELHQTYLWIYVNVFMIPKMFIVINLFVDQSAGPYAWFLKRISRTNIPVNMPVDINVPMDY